MRQAKVDIEMPTFLRINANHALQTLELIYCYEKIYDCFKYPMDPGRINIDGGLTALFLR